MDMKYTLLYKIRVLQIAFLVYYCITCCRGSPIFGSKLDQHPILLLLYPDISQKRRNQPKFACTFFLHISSFILLQSLILFLVVLFYLYHWISVLASSSLHLKKSLVYIIKGNIDKLIHFKNQLQIYSLNKI